MGGGPTSSGLGNTSGLENMGGDPTSSGLGNNEEETEDFEG